MVCFEVLLSSGRVVLVKTGFVIDKSERSSVPCRIHYPLVVLLKSWFEIFSKAGVQLTIIVALQNVSVVHARLKLFNRVKIDINKATKKIIAPFHRRCMVAILPECSFVEDPDLSGRPFL